jgi:hypothetical protein
MDGGTVTLVYVNLKKGVPWRLGPAWPGQRCGARTRRGTACLRPALKGKTRCALHGGMSTGPRTQEGLQHISDANIRHGRQTKDKLAAQRHAAKVGRRVRGELKRIESQLTDAGLMPDD